MIGALRTWLLSIIAAGLVLSILYALLPKGRLRPIVRTAGGVVLMLAACIAADLGIGKEAQVWQAAGER